MTDKTLPDDLAKHLGPDEDLSREARRLRHKILILEGRVALLEEENQALAEELREHGFPIHRGSLIHVELPPPLSEPSPGIAGALARMSATERHMLEDAYEGDTPVLVLPTGSKTDVGHWIFRRRVWLCVTRKDLILFASGRRRVIQKTPLKLIQGSMYNHVTGDIVLAPNRKFRLAHAALHPAEAYQVLAQIRAGGSD